jgi:hypothetical protein
MISVQRWGWVASAAALLAVLAGCGTPGAPLPPSLNLPEPVTDLTASRAGNRVMLTWTTTNKNTDKLVMKQNMSVWICRKETAEKCTDVGSGKLLLAPGENGAFTDNLPPDLASGAPRALSYYVELKNQRGRSAGLSNATQVLAGAPPAPVIGVTAEVRKTGIVLQWTPNNEDVPVRLQRKLLTPQTPKPQQQQGLLAPPPEPLEQNLLVDDGSQTGRAIDKDIHFGETYEYRLQRVSRIKTDGKTLELDGEFSEPVRVEARDVFPPAVPTQLVAVAIAAENDAEPAIDLSWRPDTEADIAGYIVYRQEGDSGWQRISPTQPLIAPAFHDAHVEPAHTYRYSVSAVDQGGHESARSGEIQETVPKR